MDTPLAQKPLYLSDVIDRIVARFHPEKIIMFGSRARGETEAESSLDLLVIFSEAEHTRKLAIQIGNTLSNLPISKNILVATYAEIEAYGARTGYALMAALNEGIVIYERT